MNAEQTHELMFIIAKYLKTLFPDVAESFIQRCESENLFPKPVFSQTATFEELQTSFLAGVPDDQLIRIISHVQNNSKFSSLLASMQQNTSTNSNPIESDGTINQKFFNDILCDSLRNQIDPLETVISPFYRFAAHHQIISHSDKIYCLAVDVTSQVLITGSDDFLVKIWKIPEMIPMKMFNVHIDSITDIQIHPNNQYFCSSSHDSTITVFTFQGGGRVVLKLKMENMVHNIKFSPCGTFLGAASQEGCVSIWNFNEIIEYDKNVQSTEKPQKIKYNIEPVKVIYSPKKRPTAWLSFSPNGNFVAFSCDPNLVIVSSLNENYSVKLRGHQKSPDFVFFSKITCNRILSLSSKERGIRFWESQNYIWDKSILLTNTRKIHGATFNCDESRIIGVSTRNITVWDTESKQQLFMLTHKKYTDHAKFVVSHPTIPAVVFVSTLKGRTSLWDIINGQLICGLQSEERIEINEAIWSPDGQYIFTSDALGGVTIYMADAKNKNRKISDLVPYTEMFFYNEIIETQENEDRQKVKENTFKDKSMFNQAYYRKVNSQNYEVDTLISDRIGNPLLPQPKRWFINDLNLKVAPTSTMMKINSNSDDEESIALNLMKALFTAAKSKKNSSSDMNEIDESTIVPIFHEEKDRKNQSEEENQSMFSDSNDSYESSSDGENSQRRRKKSRQEAERQREERLERRHRKLEESQNDSGFSSESTIASRRTTRQRNKSIEPKRKNLSRSSSSSTTNLIRKKSSRIKLNELIASNSSSGNSEDQEYEMDPLNEYEDENEEYEDEIEFEKEIEKEIEEEEEEEDRHESHKRQTRNTRNISHSTMVTRSRTNPRSSPKTKSKTKTKTSAKTSAKASPSRRSKSNTNTNTKTTTKPTKTTINTRKQTKPIKQQQQQQQPKKSSSLIKVKNQNVVNDSSDDDTLQSSSSSESSDLESTSVPVSAVSSSSSLYRFLLPSWTFSVKRSIHTYIPQIGDEVVYLQKGHIDWKKECNFMRFTPPYQIRPDLPQIAEARISDIKFYVTHLVITLQFYTPKTANIKGKKRSRNSNDNNYDEIVRKFALPSKKDEREILFEAKIAYPMPDSPQFIVKKSRFVYSMLYTINLKPTDVVKVEFAAPEKEKNAVKLQKSNSKLNEIDNDVKLFMGKIKSISQNWIKDPWQCINVIFTDDNKPGKLQPWELIFNEEKIKKELVASIQKSYEDDDYDEDDIVVNDSKMDQMNDSLVHSVSEMLQVKENAPFVSIRSADDQKMLRRKSKFPVDLTLICDRLANRWYTSIESLKNDIQLIKSNALVLDELNDKVADRIVDQLMKKIVPFIKEKNKSKSTKSKVINSSDSEIDSETDTSDSEADSESESDSNSAMKTRKSERVSAQKKTQEKPNRIQTRNTRRSITQQKSKSKDYDSDSSTLSSASSTTSASSSVTTTSSDSE